MTDFVCEVDEHYRSACEGLDFYGEYKGKRYCVLHLPSSEKETDPLWEEVINQKFRAQNFNFRGVYFPGNLQVQDFEFGSDVDFSGATFKGEVWFSSHHTYAGPDWKPAVIFRRPTNFSGAVW